MPGVGVIAETAKIFLSASDSAYFKNFATKMPYLHMFATKMQYLQMYQQCVEFPALALRVLL